MRIAHRVGTLLLLIFLAPSVQGYEPERSTSPEEALCATHGVLEAVCTRCNPRLIPIFKAKKDWCDPHQFPKSFCPQCRPELEGRPSMDLQNDKAPADGLRVKLKSRETVELAGIEVKPIEEGSDEPTVSAWVRLVHDPSRIARINPRATGVLRSLEAQVGDLVKPGSVLAQIESALVGVDRSKLEAARTRVRVATTNLDRQKTLLEKGVGIKRDLLAAEQDLAAAQAEFDAAQASLSVAGEIDGKSASELETPITGVVTQRNATLGQLVDSEDILFEVVDPSVLWAELQILETDVTRVVEGQTVEISFSTLPGKTFVGKLSYISQTVDPHTRTVSARVILPNPEGVLRANMYGDARIFVGPPRKSFVIPRTAVQRVEDVWLAFVRLAPDEFETRRIQLGETDAMRVHVLKGLHPGEEVATTGSFLLKTETLKGSIGAGCCEVEEKK